MKPDLYEKKNKSELWDKKLQQINWFENVTK